ncbi:MAG: hypothetical protein MUE40_04960, partial [Anaerolineae bacterium]|nr:hypothetical protein [Anaerolineae bacterium]
MPATGAKNTMQGYGGDGVFRNDGNSRASSPNLPNAEETFGNVCRLAYRLQSFSTALLPDSTCYWTAVCASDMNSLIMSGISLAVNFEPHSALTYVIDRLFSVRVVLEMTDHLSDRELYTLIYRDILPACEKKIDLAGNYLCWRCLDEADTENWLRFYATETERLQYIEQFMQP